MFGKQLTSTLVALMLSLAIAATSAFAAGSALSKPVLTMTKQISSSGGESCSATVSGVIVLSTNDLNILNSNAGITFRLRVTVEAVDGVFEGGFEGVASDIPDMFIQGPVTQQISYTRTDGFIPMSKCNEDSSSRDEFIARMQLLDADGRLLDSEVSDELRQQFE
jgi:hypothetical protein